MSGHRSVLADNGYTNLVVAISPDVEENQARNPFVFIVT